MAAQRADRRRKLLRDDARQDAAYNSDPSTPRKATRKRIYSEAAHYSHQPRITDIIPARRFVLLVCWLIGLTVPAGLSTAFFLASGSTGSEPALGSDQTFRLMAIGSLSRWWSSVMLLLAAALCGLIFHLRRHKLDDYRGRYRMWIVLVPLMVLASAMMATNLDDIVQQLLAKGLANSQFTGSNAWWPALVSALIGIAFIRLAIEMWASRVASLVLFLAAASYALVGLAWTAMWQVPDAQWREFVIFAALQCGHHHLVFALLVYARFVYRMAQGSNRKTKSRKAGSTAAETDVAIRPSRPQESHDARHSVSVTTADEQLSKSDLRRQRKEMRRQQRRAA